MNIDYTQMYICMNLASMSIHFCVILELMQYSWKMQCIQQII